MRDIVLMCFVLFGVLVFFVCMPFVSATTEVYDVWIEIDAHENFTLDKSNSYKVIIRSNESVSSGVNVTVVREIFDDDNVVVYRKDGRYSFKSRVTKTFQWMPKNHGNYTICANIASVSVNDSSADDNRVCSEIYVLNVTVPDEDEGGVFGNFSCDLSVSVSTKRFFYESGESLGIKILIEDVNHSGVEHGFVLAYWIEDLFGNVVKARYEKSYVINLSETRSYNPRAAGISDSEAYVVKAEVVDAGCNDTNFLNDFNETMILVKGASVEGDARGESWIDITKVSPEKTTFGDIISVSVDAMRGDTSKYSLSVWMERPSDGFDVSEKSTVHLKNKNTEYSLKVPVVVKSNCNGRYKDGKYELIVEGFGVRETKMIRLSGVSSSLCKTKTVTKYKDTVKRETVFIGGDDAEKAAEVSEFELVFVSGEENVSFGGEFLTEVEMRNNKGVSVNVSVYSYVIDGRTRLSEGLSDEEGVWKKSWTGNERELSIDDRGVVRVNLTNRMQRNVTGNYTLKVKVRGDFEDEIAREINVVEAVVLDDFFGVWCNATERKTYLFLDNGEDHEREVVVLSSGISGVEKRVSVDKGERKQIAYFGRVDEFVVEYEGEKVVCRPEHEEYDEELETRVGNEVVKVSFVDRVIERVRLFFRWN